MNANNRRAALFGCHFAAWRAQTNQPPVSLPARMRPLDRHSAAGLFAAHTRSAEDVLTRGAAMRVLARVDGRPAAVLGRPHAREFERTSALRGRTPRGCSCQGCAAVAVHDHLFGVDSPEVLEHGPPTIAFDSEQMITEVTTRVTAKVTPEQAGRVLADADPRNWKHAAPDFFTASDPGTYREGRWTTQPWPGDTGGLLRETVRWNWNAEDTVAVDNVLRIEDFQSSSARISYTYRLHTCLQSRFLVVWDSGGLDVDEGHYQAVYDATSETLRIEASKSVRFTAPSNGPFELALSLNLMGPATVSMLLDKLVDVRQLGPSTSPEGAA